MQVEASSKIPTPPATPLLRNPSYSIIPCAVEEHRSTFGAYNTKLSSPDGAIVGPGVLCHPTSAVWLIDILGNLRVRITVTLQGRGLSIEPESIPAPSRGN